MTKTRLLLPVGVGDTGEKEVEGSERDQPWRSSKHVSHTRTGFLYEGMRAFLFEHSAQKMFPQCLQWCWIVTEKEMITRMLQGRQLV